jgi:hypothetical protein
MAKRRLPARTLTLWLFRLAIVVVALWAAEGSATAACSGSSPMRTAASAARTDVNDCVTAAASGDTILVPAGAASWASAINLGSSKDLQVIGNGGSPAMSCTGTAGSPAYTCTYSGGTVLTCSGGCFQISMGATQRISQFSMTNSGNAEIISCVDAASATDHFRVDHNRMASTGGWHPHRCKGSGNGIHPQGIWDHNRFENGVAIHTNGTLDQFDDSCSNCQHRIWAENTPLGDSTKVIYLEANYFVTTVETTNFTDGNYGGRVVIRFNRTQGPTITGFEYHSPQGQNRGFQRWETYNNSLVDLDTTDDCYFGMALIRGGTGVWFNNAMSGSIAGCNFSATLDNVRSQWSSSVGGVGPCNGSSNWDQNVAGEQGWRCRDQIGTGRDLVLWNHSPVLAWNQEIKPAYIWGNTRSGSTVTATVDSEGRNTQHIRANRDYYDHSTATGSPQTVGVRVGPIANRPAGCTAGVAYWATDEGEWNSLQAGPDGRLYKCTAANTWTLYYTPYAYPHPWTSGTGPQAPAAPSNLRIIASAAPHWLVAGLGVCVAGRTWRRKRDRRPNS